MKTAPDTGLPIRVIVNADDFGYFDGVCKGILEAGESGRLTATGIMANGPALQRWIGQLMEMPAVSPGVHLNATLGEPLTDKMRRSSVVRDGQFPDKRALVAALLFGRLPPDTLLHEWRAQIEHCRRLGVQPVFLNSHEHIHMLPSLHRRVRRLAGECGIRHVRAPQPEWGSSSTLADVIRSCALAAARHLMAGADREEPLLIGVGPSGRMGLDYLRWRFARLSGGNVYELMCHPGRNDPSALRNPGLAAYHDWEGELRTLASPELADLLARYRIELVSYANLGFGETARSGRRASATENEEMSQ